jgi:hypothetical protein
MSDPNVPHEATHFFDRPENVQRVLRALYVACAVLMLVDFVGLALHALGGPELRHAERTWEALPGFYAGYGFVACVLLVLAATQLRRLLMRGERYYDGDA